MSLFNCVFVISSLQVAGFVVAGIQDTRPRIESHDGNLRIFAPSNKDILIETEESGRILFNRQDLTEIVKQMTKSSEHINQCTADIQSSQSRIDKVAESVSGLVQKIQVFEKTTNGTSIDRFLTILNFSRRRLTTVQRKLRVLTNLLTIDECLSGPCSNGGTCQDMYNSFICRCPDNWEGPRCDRDVNECSWYAGTELGCQNGATCVNKPGSYECMCAEGWYGIHCTKRSQDCTAGKELCGHGTCVTQSTSVGYKCICDQGWKTDGVKPACTVDVNECESYKPPCSINPPVTCINLPGTFYCSHCPPGYTGNGFYCTDVDECSIFNGGCSINPLVQCVNTPGSRICGLCPPGYVGIGTTCSYQGGVCGMNNGGCHPAAQCKDNSKISSTYVECICPAGFTGNGFGLNGCIQGAINLCTPNPCIQGECVPSVSGYSCKCNRFYTGTKCDIRKNPCDSNPCQNGGTCKNVLFSYYCICPSTYTGMFCQDEKQACGRLKSSSGSLRYPLSNQTADGNCAWVIETEHSKILNITFTNFNFPSCTNNWLQIYDGGNSAAHMIGRFCGTKLPKGGNILTSGHLVYMWYRSDITVIKPEFELTWNSRDPVCGGEISVNTHGSFKSPGAPGNYPNNRDCYWKLKAPLGKRIQFHFFSLMIGFNKNCSNDFLEFHEGLEPTDPLIGRYCNSSHPEPLFSSGNEVLVYFHSDATGSFPGFQITYSTAAGIPGCGGVYTMYQGEISSPTSSGKYPTDTLCEYKIQLPGISKVKLTFLSFSLEQSNNCEFDYVAIYDGPSVDSPLIGRYCGDKAPAPMLSIGREILIVFKSDFSNEQEGFKIEYKTVCGGKYVEPSGIINSQNYPNPQTIVTSQECVYEIVQPQGYVIILNITDINFGIDAENCGNGYLEIRDGDNSNSNLIGKYCDKAPSRVISTFNYLWMRYVVNYGIVKGFQINYVAINNRGCGGILKAKVGSVETPEDLNSYTNGLTCSWLLLAPSDYVVQITWVRFNIEESYACTYDYVRVYDNATKPGSEMGKYCGNKLPPTLISSSNALTVVFSVDSSNNLEGFLFTYTFIHERNVCGGKYFTNSGVIKSPQYPDPYPISRDCIWIVTVPAGQQIMLNATFFDIEDYVNCRYDYLEIRNGGTSASPLIGKYCGKKIPQKFTSHANQLYLRFKSDMTKTAPGFFLTWNSAATGCGGALTSPVGTIISPHYPEPYSKNAECFWKITVSAGSRIQLVFADLDLETHVDCILDYVEIFDGIGTSVKSLGKFCTLHNNLPPLIKSSSNHVTIKFRSDISFQGRGFQIQYSIVCTNVVSGFAGVIESPNFPNNYPHEQNCLWEVGVPEGNKINITFSHFEIGRLMTDPSQECSFDYLQIRYINANEDYKKVTYGTFCQDNIPSDITIDANATEINFVSDNLIVGSGFRLEWNVVGCGGIVSQPEGNIETPNYPTAYPSDTRCDWLFNSDFGNSFEITFKDIDLEHSVDCDYDFIIIYNGPDDSYPVLTKFCYTSPNPLVITSTGNSMFVRFQSDSSFRGKGFTATYRTVPSKCGGTIIAAAGNIHSPNYPKNYDKNDSCIWMIQVEENHLIDLSFQDLDLPKTCSKTFIKVYDGPSQAYPVLAKLCGNVIPNTTFTTTTNHMVVEMVTPPYYTTKGFMAKFQMACGARIKTQSSGLIDFTEKLLQTIDLQNCSWTIESERPDEHIFLTITYLNSYCGFEQESGVSIYDGENDKSPLLGHFCGTTVPPTIRSTGSILHIQLVDRDHRFNARYTVVDTDCGGVLDSVSGYIGSPNYPNNYPVDIQCEWTIKTSPGNKLTLEFSDFDLSYSDNCNEDYVEIRENDVAGNLLGVYCGTNKPNNITVDGNIWLSFRSDKPLIGDDGATAKGFKAQYTPVHGNDLYGSSGKIASPLYPRYYKGFTFDESPNTWRVTVRSGYQISVKFLDFDTDYTEYGECFLTSLEIYDGDDATAPLIGTYCGTNIPASTKSSSNVIFIKASYDNMRRGSKFLIEWKEIFDIRTKVNYTKPKIDGCGSDETITITNGQIYNLTSPNYPGKYPTSSICTWTFATTQDKHLAVSFNDININKFIPCIVGDTVSVYTGISGTDGTDFKVKERLCALNETGKIVETTNLMKVVFSPYNYNTHIMNRTGFSAVVYEVCGGTLDTPNGIITVDNISLHDIHISGVECEWNITVRSGKTIKIEFLDFSLGESKICQNYLMLKNGQYPDSPLLGAGKYCGNSTPVVPQTTGNFLYIKYISVSAMAHFTLKYSEVSIICGGKIFLSADNNSTIINSPNYPSVPSPHSECEWIIIVPGGESVRLDFLERFDLTSDMNCTKEVVEVRNGGTKRSGLLGRFCNDLPSTQTSLGNMMYIKYFTNNDFPNNGFQARASIAMCGGTIRTSGEIKSPNFNMRSLYPTNVDCTWSLVGPEDHFLILDFVKLDLPYSLASNCTINDHVTIYERNEINDTDNIIGRYCGNGPLGTIRSSGNQVFVNFKTNKKAKLLSGFKISFQSSQEKCGGTLDTDSGEITSPGYPAMNHYQRNCQWVIKVKKGRRLLVKIEDLDFDKTIDFFSQGVAFFDGEKLTSPVVYLRAGDATKLLRSSDNIMTVFFWSSHSSSHRGFKASYTSDEPTICTSNLNADSGSIVTPNSTVFKCVWLRENPIKHGHTFVLTVKAYFSNPISPCTISYSYIRVQPNGEQSLSTDVCRTTREPIVFRSVSKLILTVSHAKSLDVVNFTATYKIHSCGGIITDTLGYIISPDFANQTNRGSDIECAWLLKAPKEQSITLTFVTFTLDENCENNYLAIYNGESSKSPQIGKYCGNSIPPTINSQSNSLWLEYNKAANSGRSGFNITYEPVTNGCGGIINSLTTIIQTPHYPNSYPDNTECLWEIRAPSGYHININFTGRFQIESSSKCINDYVQIYNNFSDESKSSTEKYCGREPPVRSLNSTGDKLFVLFRSNDRTSGVGFRIHWSLICGGTFYATDKINYIVSPGYPSRYENQLYCNYTILAPNKYIAVNFEDFELEKGYGCTYDKFVVEKKNYFFSRSKHFTFCGSDKPPQIRIQNSVTMIFSTDKWITRRGFKLSYQTDDCGGNITEPSIIRANYSNIKSYILFHSIKTCKWNIIAPTAFRVTIRFLNVKLQSTLKCSTQYLEISDSKRKLATICGDYDTAELPAVHSNSNTLQVTLRFIGTTRNSSFEAAVYFTPGPSTGCGGDILINNRTSHIIDFKHQFKYDCIWKFSTDSASTLKIEIGPTMKCSNTISHTDFLNNCACGLYELRDGITSGSELIDQICDFNVNTTVTYYTSHNYAWLRIVSGIEEHVPQITITSTPSPCGPLNLKALSTPSYITTPNFPNSYPKGIKCVWRIASRTGKISIKFIEFAMNSNYDYNATTIRSCAGSDRLEIINDNARIVNFSYDFFNSKKSADVLPTLFNLLTDKNIFCSKYDEGHEFYSQSSNTLLTFYSNNNEKLQSKGFRLEYQISSCNRNYTNLQGRINKNWYSGNCSMYITVPENYTISLYFQSYTFISADCRKNTLTIYDGDASKTKLLHTCQGYVPKPIFSTGNQLYIKVYSQQKYAVNVFDITYTSSQKGRGCGGDIYNIKGGFTSPLYPQPYTNDVLCVWNIKVPFGLQVALKFTIFDVQGPCSENSVTVVTHLDDTVNEHKFCRQDNPAMLISNNQISVAYKTNSNNLGTGWKAKFVAGSDFSAIFAASSESEETRLMHPLLI